MSKDFSDVRYLALGNLSHEEVAERLLNMTRSTEDFMAVARAGHDRIRHFIVLQEQPTQAELDKLVENFQSAALDAEEDQTTRAAGQRIAEQSAQADSDISDAKYAQREKEYNVEKQDLLNQITGLQAQATAATNNLKSAEATMAQMSETQKRTEATLATATETLSNVELELTKALMTKAAVEQRAEQLQAQLDDIRQNYEIEGEEVDAETETENENDDSTDDAESNSELRYYKPTPAELKEIAVAHGFRVRPQPGGKEDLNPYVYETMYAGIEMSHKRTAEGAVNN